MLKRELIRMLACGIAGLIIGIERCVHTGLLLWLLCPVYAIGLLYSGILTAKMIAGAFGSYFRGQVACLWSRPLLGTLICILTLILSLGFILCVGWLVGIVRCVKAVSTAVQEDRKLNGLGGGAFQ